MARQHGRFARIYVGIASNGTAEPVNFIGGYTIDSSTDRSDVTAFGDTNKVAVAGLPTFKGTYKGFFDDATQQLYTASQDGVARKFYLYTDTRTNAIYWFGTAYFDFAADFAVEKGEEISGSFDAATNVSRVG